jgi:hypothetical protein
MLSRMASMAAAARTDTSGGAEALRREGLSPDKSQRRRYPVGVSSPSGLPLLPVQGPDSLRADRSRRPSDRDVCAIDAGCRHAAHEQDRRVVRNHVRQLLRNIDIVLIQFSELFKLHEERADGLRRDMSAYVRSIANVIKEGQKDGTFVDYRPRRRYTCDSSRGGRRWRRRRLAEAYAAAACSTASKVAALCSAW